MSERVRRAYLQAAPAPGDRAILDPEESHHVARVLRLRAGDPLAVFDGRGGEWEATIEDVSRDGVSVLVGAPRPGAVEPSVSIVLHQAHVRPEKLEWVLQKGTEIGIGAFRLIPSERAEAPPPSPARVARCSRIVMEACKQSGRRRLPPVTLGEIGPPPSGVIAIVLEGAPAVAPLGGVLAGPPSPGVWLAVGPEGGFSESEVAAMTGQGWRAASLGPRTLRTEKAGAVAASIVLHLWGDLGNGRPPAPL